MNADNSNDMIVIPVIRLHVFFNTSITDKSAHIEVIKLLKKKNLYCVEFVYRQRIIQLNDLMVICNELSFVSQ